MFATLSKIAKRVFGPAEHQPTPHQIAYGNWRVAAHDLVRAMTRRDEALARGDDRDLGRANRDLSSAMARKLAAENTLFPPSPLPPVDSKRSAA